MKVTSITLILAFLTINLYAEKNWIQIKQINETQVTKSKKKVDVNLSKIEPINKMMRNATIIKQLFEATNKKDIAPIKEKNWFLIKKEN